MQYIYYLRTPIVPKLFLQTLNNFKAFFPVDKSIPYNITTLYLTYLTI